MDQDRQPRRKSWSRCRLSHRPRCRPGSGLLNFTLRDIPPEPVDAGPENLSSTFIRRAAENSGSNYLQVSTLKQVGILESKDSRSDRVGTIEPSNFYESDTQPKWKYKPQIPILNLPGTLPPIARPR